MPGIASASLMGFAIPIASGAAWEHTYAESSCGLSWGCWGRNAGGRPLGNAMGSSIIADCLSQLNSRAGLVYGVTAVCHQTANRILHPAGITVALGGGYGTSWSLFRVYGLGPWPQKATCYLSQAASGGPGGSPSNGPPSSNLGRGGGSGAGPSKRGVDGMEQAERGSLYDRTIMMVHKYNTFELSNDLTEIAELEALIQLGLGEPVDKSTL